NVITVKAADAIERQYQCLLNAFPVEVTGPKQAVTLYLDNVRVRQEVPTVLARRGRLFQFPGRAEPTDPPLLWPGFTPIEVDTLWTAERGFGWTKPKATRQTHAHSFRSCESGLLWGCCTNLDAPLRIDV